MAEFETDFEDLQAFALRRDEEAFARLVKRHADFVYATCLRQVRDPSMAQDAAQAVFVLLAQRARKISRQVRLVGWLHNVARYASSNALRGERRRKRHEKEAAVSAHLNANDPVERAELDQVVDVAMSRLREPDRDVLLMRFFQDQSHDEIGMTLGLSGHAAKMRVLRAVERLRSELARDGVTMMPSALEAGMMALAGKGAPAGFAAAATKAALFGSNSLARATATAMTLSKLKIAAVVCIALLATSGAAIGVWYAQQTTKPPLASVTNATTQPAWREKFDAVYHLNAGETVKWIRPPFIAERAEYYRQMHPDRAKNDPRPPVRWLFHWDGKQIDPQRYTYGTGGRVSLRYLLDQVTELRPEQYSMPRRFLELPVEGDWMVREGATIDERMAGIGEAISRNGDKIRFEKKRLDRDVVVVRGSFLPEEWPDGKIKLFAGEKAAPASQTWSGSGRLAFAGFEDAIGRPVINEWKGIGDRQVNISIERGLNLEALPPEQAEAKLKRILKNLAEQSGLEFKTETRSIDTWVLTEGATRVTGGGDVKK